MAEEYRDGKITLLGVFPFLRSLENVEKGKADFHMPYITPTNPNRILFQYSTDVIFKVMFILCTNKNNKDISPTNLNKYKIETDVGVKYILDGPIPNIVGSPSLESSGYRKSRRLGNGHA